MHTGRDPRGLRAALPDESSFDGYGTADDAEATNPAEDDRNDIAAGDRVLLIVENDLAFSTLLLVAARQCGFKGLFSAPGSGAL